MDIDKANKQAVERMMQAQPVVTGMGKALDAIPGMQEDLLLHAGPPITWERASGPMRGAITGALIFEGKAKDESSAMPPPPGCRPNGRCYLSFNVSLYPREQNPWELVLFQSE